MRRDIDIDGVRVQRYCMFLNAASTSRDSFAKALYDRLFTWIVGHVNSVIGTVRDI